MVSNQLFRIRYLINCSVDNKLACFIKKILVLIFLLVCAIVSVSHAATMVWDGGGPDENWSSCANWDNGVSPDTCPGVADIASFTNLNVSNVTIDVSIDVEGFDIQNTYTGAITQASGVTVLVGNSGFLMDGGTFNGGNSTITLNGIASFSNGEFISTGGTLIFGDDITMSNGTFVSNGGNVEMSNGVRLINTGTNTFFDINFNTGEIGSGSFDITGTVYVANDITITAVNSMRSGAIEVEGNVTTLDTDVGTGTDLIFVGDNNQLLSVDGGGGSGGIPNFHVNKTDNTLTIRDVIYVGDIIYLQGTVDATTFDSTIVFRVGSHDVDMDTGAATMALDNVEMSPGDGAAGWIRVTDTMTILGDLTLGNASGGTINFVDNNNGFGGIIQLHGDLTSYDSNIGGDDVDFEFTGGRAQIITAFTGGLDRDFPNSDWVINKTSASDTVTLNGNLTTGLANGFRDLQLTQGIFDLAGSDFTIGGTFVIGGAGTLRLQGDEIITISGSATTPPTLSAGGTSATVIYNGTVGPYAVRDWPYQNLIFNGASGTWVQSTTLTINNNLTLVNGTLDTANNAINVSGYLDQSPASQIEAGTSTISVGGDFSADATIDNTDYSNASLVLNGTAAQFITSNGSSFNNLIVTNTTDVVTFSDALDTTNLTATVSNTQLSFAAGGVNTHTISGTLDLNGQVAAGEIILRSVTPGSPFILAVGSTQSVSYVNVSDSNADGSNIIAYSSINNGGNDDSDGSPQWMFGSALIVTNTNDSGAGSLRQAMLDLDADGGETIVFDNTIFPVNTPATITLSNILPILVQGGVTIDGSNAGVIVNGSAADCFLIESDNNTIKGLRIENCSDGISIDSGTDNTIGGDYTQGSAPHGEGNIIVNNGAIGIKIFSSNNRVFGNLIGNDGAIAEGNVQGIWLGINAQSNTIGSAIVGLRNVISGNSISGITLADSATSFNRIIGNYIGTNVDGTSSIANGIANNGTGMELFAGTNNNIIGGDAAGEGNLISGNSGIGLLLDNSDSNTITGNTIGTDITGALPLGNSMSGVRLRNGSSSNTIGGTTSSARNIISANGGSGIRFNDSSTELNLVTGNYIGVDVSGTADLGNSSEGIVFFSTANSNVVGGTAAGARNIISGNDSEAIAIYSSSGIVISGNYIGTNESGSAAIGNSSGISVSGGGSHTIGGNSAGAGNVISGNGSYNITVSGSDSSAIKGNIIGLNAAGNAILGATGYGITVQNGALSNTVGGITEEERNIISGHFTAGIYLRNVATSGNTVLGNYIGTDITGTAPLGNARGILLNGTNNIIGGTAANSGNVIAWNSSDGIYSNAFGSNTILGNYIGTNASSDAMPNGDGIDLDDGSMILGSASELQSNVIASNSNYGIRLRTSGTLTLGGTVDLDDDLDLINGTLDMGSATLQLSGDWINSGVTVNPGTSNLILDGTDQSISGSSTFNNLSKTTTTADTLTFPSGQTQTITGTLDLQGSAGNYLSLVSSSNGVQWNIDPQGGRNIAFLIVSDSNNVNVLDIDATADSVDAGNNTNWLFPAAAPFLWSNNNASGDNTWSTGSNWVGGVAPGAGDLALFISTFDYPVTIDIPINIGGIQVSAGYTSTLTQQAGNTLSIGSDGYSQAGGSFIGGDSLIDFTDGSFTLTGGIFTNSSGDMAVDRNVTVTGGTYTDSGTIRIMDHNDALDDSTLACTGVLGGVVEIDKSHLDATVRLDAGCSINLGNNPNSRLASTLTNDGSITITSGTWTEIGDGTYVNNGTLTHSGSNWISSGSFNNTATGTITYAGTTLSFERNFTQNGIVDLNGKTLTFTGDDSADDTVLTCGAALTANVVLNKPAADRTFTLGSDCTIQGDFTRTNGPILNPASTFTLGVEGNVDISGNDLTGGTNFTLLMSGDNSQTLALNTDDFDSELNINKTDGVVTLMNDFTSAGASSSCDIIEGTLDINSNNFVCGAMFTVQDGGVLQLEGGETVSTPTLNSDSTIIYDGSAGYTVNDWFYHHLSFSGPGTWNQTADLDINGDLNIVAGTLTSSGNNITLAGDWNKAAASTYTSGLNTVLLDGSNQSITGSSTFNNLTKNITSTDTLSFQGGTTQTITGLADLQGGDASNRLLLRSLIPGNRVNMVFNGSTLLNFLDVADSDASLSSVTKPLNPANSMNAGNTIDWFSGSINAITSIVAEITPNSAFVNSTNNAFVFYMLPTITGVDSGFNQSIITSPVGYSNQVVSAVFVNGVPLIAGAACPTVTDGEYCNTVVGENITINFGTAITTNLTPVQVNFTTNTPDAIGVGSFTFTVDDTLTDDLAQSGIAGDADSNTTNSNSLDVDIIPPTNAVTSVIAEITPNIANSNSTDIPLSFYLRPTINAGDSGLNRVTLSMPTGYSNFNVTTVTVDGLPVAAGVSCPAVGSEEYCQLVSSQDINIDFGSAITTTLATIKIDLTSDTPDTVGPTTFTYSVDDTATDLVLAQSGMAGNADGDTTNNDSLDVILVRVDPALSAITLLPEIIVADGSSAGVITIKLVNNEGLPVSGKSIQISSSRPTIDTITLITDGEGISSSSVSGKSVQTSSSRSKTDTIILPTGVTDVDGIVQASISSLSAGIADITALNTTDGMTLLSNATAYFTQGEVLTLRKKANKKDVTVGDLVTYTIEIMNNSEQAVELVKLETVPPDNFKYRRESSLYNGAPVADPNGRRTLIFDPITIPELIDSNGNGRADPGETGYVKYSYQLIVGSGAMPGVYSSSAVAKDVCDLCVISNSAKAEVTVTLDPLFDLGTIIGKVFHDKNGDNRQDDDEPGIAGAMVVLDEGTYAITDSHGRYHFPAVTPGERLLKINLASLVSGTTLSDGETQVISVSPGLLAKANFGATQNVVTRKTGKEGTQAFMISIDEKPKKISLVGNAKLQMVIINGNEVKLPKVDVRMKAHDIPSEVIHFNENKILQPAVFHLQISQPEEVTSWSLNVMTPDSKSVHSFNGDGVPPKIIEWNGIKSDNTQLIGGQLYHYQLTINYKNGARATSARRLIGVDQKTTAELNLSGDSFNARGFELNENVIAMLAEVAKTLRRFPSGKVVIEGHSDSAGDKQVKLELSRKRVLAVLDYLVDVEGISYARFDRAWYGDTRPIANNNSVEGRMLNRRVEIKGLVSDFTRAQRHSRFHSTAKASINGEETKLDPRGRFSLTIEDHRDVVIELSDQHGGSISTQLSVPQLTIIQPEDEQLIAHGGVEQKNDNSSDHKNVPLGHQDYQFIGKTEPGSVIKIGATEIATSRDGQFRYPIKLSSGKQLHQIIVHSPQGFTYITELNIDIRAQDTDNRAYHLEDPIPELEVDFPKYGSTVKAGSYTLSGRTALGNVVLVNERVVNVEPDGRFVHTLTLKQGENPVIIKAIDPQGYTGTIEDIIDASQSQFFFMAFADGKFGQLNTKGYIQGSGNTDAREFYSEGRIAFYFKGKIKGNTLITAALDTGQGELNSLFSDLDDNATRALLSNIDPDYYYPVYGDNSTVVYDTQSQGKFYLALDNDTIHAVLGNYKLNLSNNELAAYRRTLYGGYFEYQSLSRSKYGHPDTVIQLFGAQTRQSYIRDELRATGGSLYYLSQRDIIEGSEQVSLVVKDKNTGLTISRQPQQQNIDYSIKYLGGRLLFTRPISSVKQDNNIINNALLAGNPVYIEVEYEYYVSIFEKRASGAHARQQLGNHVAVGATYVDDELTGGRYKLQGIDGEIRIMKNSRIIAEVAHSSGSEGETFTSGDGGLTFSPILAAQESGKAIKLSTEIDIGEFVGKPDQFKGGAYFKELDPGFQATGNSGDQGKQKLGADMMVKITDKNTLKLKHDREQSTGITQAGSINSTQQSTAQWVYKSEKWSVTSELNEQQSKDNKGAQLSSNSLAATKLVSTITDKLEASISHQATLEGVENDQSTIGLTYKLTDKIQLQGSATGGDKGGAGEARIAYRSKKINLYLTERFNDGRAGKTTSTIIGGETSVAAVAGAESGKVYSEYQWDNTSEGDQSLSLVGAEQRWAIEDGWKFNLGTEYSDINARSGTSRRTTVAAGLSYKREGLKMSTRNEIRNDRGAEHKRQMLTSNTFQYNLNPDYVVLGKFRYSVTRNLTRNSDDARFDEQSIGLAYRPVRHDIFNALARYTRLSDMSPLNLGSDTPVTTKIDVLSVEWSYQISKKLEWSEKQAIRFKTEKTGERAEFKTQTHLSIHRLNYALPKKFSVGAEYRMLRQREANDQREGWLIELNWKAARHLRLGVGFNFTDFSDNEFSNNDYSTAGWFIRIQGKY